MQEVCGSWAGRKRLVAVRSGERVVGVESGCVGAVVDWETCDVDKWGQGDVVGDGRDAG